MSTGQPRYSIIPADAVTDRRLESRDLQVLCLLGRHTDRKGWCCRSQVKMARELGCGRATVQRALARLVGAGYVEHRPQKRESNADAAAEYRVILDMVDDDAPPHDRGSAQRSAPASDAPKVSDTELCETSKGGAHTRAPLPTHGQGCPPIGGQGVPTHGRAPMLTSPVKRLEKERAREDEEFEKARRAWPSGFADSREEALAVWQALSPDDRSLAVAEIDRFKNSTKAIGRTVFCSLAAYLAERKWEALPPRPVPVCHDIVKSSARPAPRSRPTAYQLAHKEQYPELFGDGGAAKADEAAA